MYMYMYRSMFYFLNIFYFFATSLWQVEWHGGMQITVSLEAFEMSCLLFYLWWVHQSRARPFGISRVLRYQRPPQASSA